MGHGRKPFLGFLIQPVGQRPFDKDGLEVDATLYLTFPAYAAPPDIDYQADWQQLNFKMGLLIREGQQATLSYRRPQDVQLSTFNQVDAVTTQITAFFGRDAGQAWVGFVPDSFVQPDFVAANVAAYSLRLQIRPRLARKQLVPAVIRYHQGDFADRAGLAGAWVLPVLT